MLTKIISGGQTGADQGGLYAARLLGLQTGGTAPPNWMTEDGPARELLEGFGLIEGEHDPRTYPKRTLRNVLDSNATVMFGRLTSTGSQLTLRYCRENNRRVLINPSPYILANVIDLCDIKILNVAGNRESKNPGIRQRTEDRISHVIRLLTA